MLPRISLYFVEENNPNRISYTVVEITQEGNSVLAHGVSVRMLEIVALAYSGQCRVISQYEFYRTHRPFA